MVLDHSGTVPDSTAGFSLFARFPVPPVCFFSATGATSFCSGRVPRRFRFSGFGRFRFFRRSFFGLYPRRGV